jgi:hypothetical protein
MASESGAEREADRRSTPWTDYKGLSDDVVITRQIKILLSSYRRDDYADPEGFVVQLAALFERYPRNVIVEVTNPLNLNSIQRKHPTYPPNIGEVADALAAEDAEQARIAKALNSPKPVFHRRYVPPPNFPGCRANMLVLKASPQYGAASDIVESGQLDKRDWKIDEHGRGIWLGLNVWNNFVAGRSSARQVGSVISEASLRAEYGRAEAERHDSDAMFDPPSAAL